MMDAAEIARLPRDKPLPELLRDWAKVLDIPSGKFVNEDLEAAADALEQALNDAATLAADQCQDGYGDDYGNHACKVVDAMRTQRDAAQQDAKDARALLDDAALHLKATGFNEGLRARIEAMLEKKSVSKESLDSAVEAAARQIYGSDWDDYASVMMDALTAALPHLLAAKDAEIARQRAVYEEQLDHVHGLIAKQDAEIAALREALVWISSASAGVPDDDYRATAMRLARAALEMSEGVKRSPLPEAHQDIVPKSP